MELEKDKFTFIKQPYSLTISKYKYNLYEKRILVSIVSSLQNVLVFREKNESDGELADRINKICKRNYRLQLKVKDLIPDGSKNHANVRVALESLLNKKIIFNRKSSKNNEKVTVFTGLILEAEYKYKSEVVDILISKNILPYFILVAGGFTRYAFEVAFGCRSSYTIRIYEYICHWRDVWSSNNGHFRIKIEELKEFLYLDDKYVRSNDFKTYILIPASKELKSKGDIWFTIEEAIKETRKVVGWKIKVYKKQASASKPLSSPILSAVNTYESVKRRLSISSLEFSSSDLKQKLIKKFKLSSWQVRVILDKVPAKDIHNTLYEITVTKADNRIRNIGGYTANIFNKKYNLNFIK